MTNKQRKKIFYVPGMISLIFIPLLCLVYFYKTDSFNVYGSLVFVDSDEDFFYEYKVPSLRKYKKFDLNGSLSKEQKSLNELQFFLRDLVKEKDTINGAKVIFGPKTHYDVFISVLDILAVEKVSTSVLHNDDIYIIGSNNKPKRDKNKITATRMNCGTSELMRQEYLRKQENLRVEEKLQYQILFFKSQWILFLGYFGIVLINILVLVKFNKNK
ncbi:hypothetical protein [Flavobacterium sp. GNP001]